MAVLRALKWISFVVFILAIALCGVGYYFVCADMNICNSDKADDVLMIDIKTELSKHNALKELFGSDGASSGGAQAEGVAPEATFPADFNTVQPEVTPAPEATAQPFVAAEPTSAPAETPATQPENAEAPAEDASGYTLDGHGKLVVALMKYGTESSQMKWLTGLFHMENTEINISLFVAYCALFLAFLFHVITKRHKTVYGTILMVLGYLFFAAFIALGYYFSDYAFTFVGDFSKSDKNDWPFYRAIFISCSIALGALIGLPIYSCGVRQITNKRLRNRLLRRASKY